MLVEITMLARFRHQVLIMAAPFFISLKMLQTLLAITTNMMLLCPKHFIQLRLPVKVVISEQLASLLA